MISGDTASQFHALDMHPCMTGQVQQREHLDQGSLLCMEPDRLDTTKHYSMEFQGAGTRMKMAAVTAEWDWFRTHGQGRKVSPGLVHQFANSTPWWLMPSSQAGGIDS